MAIRNPEGHDIFIEEAPYEQHLSYKPSQGKERPTWVCLHCKAEFKSHVALEHHQFNSHHEKDSPEIKVCVNCYAKGVIECNHKKKYVHGAVV